MVATVASHMSLADYMRIFEEEGAFEFIEGQIIFMPQKTSGDNYRANMLALVINQWAAPQKRGIAFVEMPFVLPDTEQADWIRGSRIPDMMFIRQENLSAYDENTPDWDNKPLAVIPDLVVEFISPTDKFVDVSRKIETYLRDGVKLVWLVNSAAKNITVYLPNTDQQTLLSEERMLSGGDVLPGFEIPVKAIFSNRLIQWDVNP